MAIVNNIKTCKICAVNTSKRWYFGNICRSCRRKELYRTTEKLKEWEYKAILKANPSCWDCGKQTGKRWYKDSTQCSNCLSKENRIKNLERVIKNRRIWAEKNKEHVLSYKREYNKKTKNNVFLQSKRKAQKRKAMPKWVDVESLKNVYKSCPKNMTVDHIIPLQNEIVSGLHIPQNLQYLSLTENSKKHNKFDGTYKNESWKLNGY